MPNADAVVTFQIEGPARILGIGNGDLKSIESAKNETHRTYQGRGLVILRITDQSATITIKASSPGLEAATVVLSPGAAAK